ncbi:RNA-binding KH domain-containing protein PEPPER-like [Rutidosis leptorrhynchoides]|uniref:RNA-binding KH domain-containing protein PEPPER-like n=1 Tax=Rutidosis leptorrhynchoides TaxID=125765 RepID=UPI003A9A2817
MSSNTDSDSEVPINTTVENIQTEEGEASPENESVPEIETTIPEKKWPGWPGDCVFRVVVPVLKVGTIIGKKGDVIRKMCEETKARIRILEGPIGNPDRIVLISGKEDTEVPFSSAMDAVIRVFKLVNGFSEDDGEDLSSIQSCSIRLLVTSLQAMSLIGKQGSSIKTIQESSGCTVSVFPTDEVSTPSAILDHKVVDIQGEASKALKALEAVLGHLRKFLIDRSVLPLFEMIHNDTATQEDPWVERSSSRSRVGHDYPRSSNRELASYGRDYGLSTSHSPVLGSTSASFVTQVVQTMQIPVAYAEDIIGVGGRNIAYIRRTSGAMLTVEENRGLRDEISIELKGTLSQVQEAQQLIQDCVDDHNESVSGGYGNKESGQRSTYSRYPDSSYSQHSYDGYGRDYRSSYRR